MDGQKHNCPTPQLHRSYPGLPPGCEVSVVVVQVCKRKWISGREPMEGPWAEDLVPKRCEFRLQFRPSPKNPNSSDPLFRVELIHGNSDRWFKFTQRVFFISVCFRSLFYGFYHGKTTVWKNMFGFFPGHLERVQVLRDDWIHSKHFVCKLHFWGRKRTLGGCFKYLLFLLPPNVPNSADRLGGFQLFCSNVRTYLLALKWQSTCVLWWPKMNLECHTSVFCLGGYPAGPANPADTDRWVDWRDWLNFIDEACGGAFAGPRRWSFGAGANSMWKDFLFRWYIWSVLAYRICLINLQGSRHLAKVVPLAIVDS